MWYILAGFFGLFLYFRFKISSDRWKAANNVVVAAYTFGQLSPDQQQVVIEAAFGILRRSGFRGDLDDLRLNDAAKFGWYALAMAELGIAPGALLTGWNYVQNPFIAITPGHKDISSVAELLARKVGAKVTIDAVDHSRVEVSK